MFVLIMSKKDKKERKNGRVLRIGKKKIKFNEYMKKYMSHTRGRTSAKNLAKFAQHFLICMGKLENFGFPLNSPFLAYILTLLKCTLDKCLANNFPN